MSASGCEITAFGRIKMMQGTVRYSAIAAIIPALLLSVAILISAAQAQDNPRKARTALACGQELKKQCSGVSVQANNMLECLQKNQEKLSARCVARANNVVRMCERDAAQRCQNVVAGQGNILGCLTTAKRSVSRRCNAALDAAFLRQ
jgi:cysteine rich repeat protein